MDLERLPFDAPLDAYAALVGQLRALHQQGSTQAAKIIGNLHPRYRDPEVAWKVDPFDDAAVLATPFTEDDARLVVARGHDFRDWDALAAYTESMNGPARELEAAVEAVVNGDLDGLKRMLAERPGLVHERSARITCFDPPVHRATLLHYVAANGVEGYRQKTPPNAVEIMRTLLEVGAEPNSPASLYGGECTTMALLVSSDHPAKAGLQVALAELLLDYGAAAHPAGAGKWTSPVWTSLVFGYLDVARALARRGAPVDDVTAAGLGDLEAVRAALPSLTADQRHRALILASQLGHAPVVRLLIEAGEDPNRFNPDGMHAHSTPLHQAALAGHLEVARILIEQGNAKLDIEDKLWHGTPLGWARYNGQREMAEYLSGPPGTR